MNRKAWIALCVCVVGVISCFLLIHYTAHKVASVPVEPKTLTAASQLASSTIPVATSTPIRYEIVTTPAAQERGLGGRAVIPDNYAMFFLFPKADVYGFWMKDMLTSIDMVWLNDSGMIVKIDNSVPADSYPKVFYPPQPVRFVLETRAGFAAQKGWKIGTKIDLPLPY